MADKKEVNWECRRYDGKVFVKLEEPGWRTGGYIPYNMHLSYDIYSLHGDGSIGLFVPEKVKRGERGAHIGLNKSEFLFLESRAKSGLLYITEMDAKVHYGWKPLLEHSCDVEDP